MMLEPPRPLEACFFDLGDTLIRADPSWSAVYLEGLRREGIEVSLGDLERALVQAGPWVEDGPFEATEQAAYERIKAFDARVLAGLGHGEVHDRVFRTIERLFAERTSWHVFPDVLPALERLRSAGLRLGVISNWTWGAPQLMHDLELARHFDLLVISARTGYQKPHPEIFRRALGDLEVRPETAIHVGDSVGADVVGARGVGMLPVLIDRGIDDPVRIWMEQPDAQDELMVISDLTELTAWLEASAEQIE